MVSSRSQNYILVAEEERAEEKPKCGSMKKAVAVTS
jgi:hypothetical protein